MQEKLNQFFILHSPFSIFNFVENAPARKKTNKFVFSARLLAFFLYLCTKLKQKTMKKTLISIICTTSILLSATAQTNSFNLSREEAVRLSSLPLKCMQQEFPNKLGQVLANREELASPRELHPAFFGCFDWHSAVHGHWLLVRLLKIYPDLDNAALIRQKLAENISAENIKIEVSYFKRPHERTFQRPYGWGWLLKLAEELHTWNDPFGRQLYANLQPLVQTIVERFFDFLPRLDYPVRVGEHSNTAFGMSFAWDYAGTVGNQELMALIKRRALDYYWNDKNCPLEWEPGGFDFFSPCLEQADLMRRVLSVQEFETWLGLFLPQLKNPNFRLEPARVSDRTDGKIVHLDGLNFSRARCLNEIAKKLPKYIHLKNIATEHINFSLPQIVDGYYEGEHWLASFAMLALMSQW